MVHPSKLVAKSQTKVVKIKTCTCFKCGQKSENKCNLGTKQYVAITQWRKISNFKRILIFPFLAPYICGSRMSLYCVIGLHGFLEISVTATREEREGWCCYDCYNNVNCRRDERIPFKFVCSFCSGQAEDSNYSILL